MTDLRFRSLCGRLALAACLLATVSVATAQNAATSDWPGWRGPQRNGVSTDVNWGWNWPAAGPKIAWRAQVGNGFSSFAVASGRVYTMGNTADVDTVFCFDAANGNVLWQYSYPCPRDPLAYEGGPNSTPLVEGDRVYTLSKFGHCFCLNAQTGVVLWQRKFERSPQGPDDYKVDWGFAGSPLLAGEKLILPVGTAGLALDKTTGETLWDNGPGRSGYSSPVPCQLGGQQAFILLSGHEVVGVAAQTGAVLWRFPWKTTWDQNAPDVVVEGDRLFVSTGHGVGCAQYDLTATPPALLWRNKDMRNYLNSCVLWQGNLYGFTEEGPQLRCLDWRTGAARWSAGGLGQGSLIAVDGKLVVLSEKGRLVIAEATPEAYRPLAEADILSGRCWTTPAFANGRLYARNAAGEVVCVDLRGQ